MTGPIPGTLTRTDAIALIAKALSCGAGAAKDLLDKNFGTGTQIPKNELVELLRLIRQQTDLRHRITVRMREIRQQQAEAPEPAPPSHSPADHGPSLG